MEPIHAIYDFSAKTLSGKEESLSQYQGKVVLVVNTASKCGFTPQYEGLEKLYQELAPRGLVILGFPCNQFGGQEPGGSEEIAQFCSMNYGVSFPMFDKVNVNGDDAHPLFKFLKGERPGILGSEAIKWNFTKFLVDKQGVPVKRFASMTKPESLKSEIEPLL